MSERTHIKITRIDNYEIIAPIQRIEIYKNTDGECYCNTSACESNWFEIDKIEYHGLENLLLNKQLEK